MRNEEFLMKNNSLFTPLLLATLGLFLQACGGAADSDSSGQASGAIGPHTIVLSYPISDSIENLGGGFYRRVGKVTVTDSEGNGIAGVTVNLKLIDSVIAQGTILTADTDFISGGVLHDTGPLDGGGNPTAFNTATVSRNAAIRKIEFGDHLLLFNAEDGDKRRYINELTPLANDLYVSTAYLNVYPNTIYDSSTPEKTTQYVVGASLLGGSISGSSGTTDSTTTDSNGIATFYVTYPNSISYINTGCGISGMDARHLPMGSSQVYVIAWVNDQVAAISTDFCFSPIAEGSISPDGLTVSAGSTGTYTVRDGGDSVRIPYTAVYVNGAFAGFTDIVGNIDITVGGTGTYVITANGGATATTTVP